MTPAERIVELFGGIKETSAALGLSESSGTVYRWLGNSKKDKQTRSGSIPMKHRDRILEISDEKGWGLKYEDLRG